MRVSVCACMCVCAYVLLVSSLDHFFPFLLSDGGKKGLMDLHRLFCSPGFQILGGVDKYKV